MFIICQNCHRIYDVPADVFNGSKGRFRCCACGFVWDGAEAVAEQPAINETAASAFSSMAAPTPTPAPAASEKIDVVDVIDEIEDKPAQPLFKLFSDKKTPEPPEEGADNAFYVVDEEDVPAESQKPKRHAWLGFFVLASLVFSLYFGRAFWAHYFPVLEKGYQFLGLEIGVVGEGLNFQDVSYDVVYEGDAPYMLIRGNIVNTTDRTKRVPLIHISLKGTPVQDQTIVPVRESLDAGQKMSFETKIALLSTSVRHVFLDFRKGLHDK